MKIRVFYDDNQTAEKNSSFSPSAVKPAKALASWRKLGVPLEVLTFKPLKPSEISIAHDPEYVKKVLTCQIANGFGNTLPEVAKTLPWVSGSFVAATLDVLHTRGVAISPTSGAHHAGWDFGGGFCTFNFLMIAAVRALEAGAKRVGILDLDQHGSNGCYDIIKKMGLEDKTVLWDLGSYGPSASQAERWLAEFPTLLQNKFHDCDIVLCQLGVDCHVEDPLGGCFTTEQLKKRDNTVFTFCQSHHIPLVVNLAGGYQQPIRKVLDLHDAMIKECWNVYGKK